MAVNKTQVIAEPEKQEILITRGFDAPAELVYRAFSEAEIFEQWMTTKVLQFDFKKLGAYQFQTNDAAGNVAFKASGAFHDVVLNEKIVRTFEMENSPFSTQLEFLEFENVENGKCKLTMHSIFKSVELRDKLLQQPFAFGLNMAHDRLQIIINKLT